MPHGLCVEEIFRYFVAITNMKEVPEKQHKSMHLLDCGRHQCIAMKWSVKNRSTKYLQSLSLHVIDWSNSGNSKYKVLFDKQWITDNHIDQVLALGWSDYFHGENEYEISCIEWMSNLLVCCSYYVDLTKMKLSISKHMPLFALLCGL